MLYNNDDFEKLFRKAAKGYPLKTDSANWDDLAAKLETSQKTAVKKNKWTYSLIILLPVLITVSLLVYRFNTNTNDNNIAKEAASASIPPIIKGSLKDEVPGSSSNVAAVTKEPVLENQAVHTEKQYLLPAEINILGSNTNINTGSFNESFKTISNINLPERILYNEDIMPVQSVNAEPAMQKERLKNEMGSEIAADDAANAPESNQIKLKLEKRIYGVAYGGPELTSVKFQRASSPGYRLGVALGYKINNRFNIEVGLQRERIDFYSDGRYIDTSLLKIQKGNDVEKAYASSKITSVPLKLKYNFWQKKNSSFFIGAGVNAVIITHSERYNYAVSKNGVQGYMSKQYSALTMPKYFSGVSFSGGYQTKVAGDWSIKAEPYYQAPVKNFGVGKIPVSNFGIDIGIIKDLK
ncbi:Outer membrane protein beta-barrel domain-containing protein [Parafilimonas terrae]|uniref:Outer membrane protein beta-barrel domain-containing protein n=2 Tax=Parafilimonas terrae TaxID=1465490 RepID=A0A1I5U664_9BACT|nr:Outer membrane protein beta-barrel domain-containing protein [Parafilimonas terrae]